MQLALGVLRDAPAIQECFRSGAGFGWHEHDTGLFEGTERFFRPGYVANLVAAWLPALDGVVVAGSQMPDALIAFRLGPAAVLIAVLWMVGLLLITRAHSALPWHESGEAPDNQAEPRGHSRQKSENKATDKGTSTAKSATIFGVAALVTLVAGVGLERSGDSSHQHGENVPQRSTAQLCRVSVRLVSVRVNSDPVMVASFSNTPPPPPWATRAPKVARKPIMSTALSTA